MKKTTGLTTAFIGLLALSMFNFSCARREEGTNEVKVEDKPHTEQENKVIDQAQREAERQEYRHEQERRIKENNDRIDELKAQIDHSDKNMREEYRKRIDELRERNEKLKARMEEYKYEDETKWDNFKREWNHDMDELGTALKDFTVRNTEKK
jgi:chromosome segregation ATPase